MLVLQRSVIFQVTSRVVQSTASYVTEPSITSKVWWNRSRPRKLKGTFRGFQTLSWFNSIICPSGTWPNPSVKRSFILWNKINNSHDSSIWSSPLFSVPFLTSTPFSPRNSTPSTPFHWWVQTTVLPRMLLITAQNRWQWLSQCPHVCGQGAASQDRKCGISTSLSK